MTTPATPESREQAAQLLGAQGKPRLYTDDVRRGLHDHGPTVQWFARQAHSLPGDVGTEYHAFVKNPLIPFSSCQVCLAPEGAAAHTPGETREAIAERIADEICPDIADNVSTREQRMREYRIAKEAALAALTPSVLSGDAGEGWREIASAPKDGAHVVIWVDGMEVTASFDEDEKEWFNGKWGLGFSEVKGPTHWKPLPRDPSSHQGAGE